MKQIKVNTYTIQVREKNRAKSKNAYLNFENIVTSEDEILDIKDMFKSFIKSFDEQFLGTRSSNKAMRLTDDLSFGSSSRVISGTFLAGVTGEEKLVYEKKKDDKEIPYKININQVNTSEYCFYLWLPSSSSTGVLIVQGTSTESAGDLFKTLFHSFFNKYLKNYVVRISRYTSSQTVEEFKQNSDVSKIVLSNNHYPKDVVDGLLGQEITTSDVKIKIVIEGNFKDKLIDKIEEYTNVNVRKPGKFFTSETLDALQFDDDTPYDTTISLIDKTSKKAALAKASSGFAIKPFTYLPESRIERDPITEMPILSSIKKAVKQYFKEIKNEFE